MTQAYVALFNALRQAEELSRKLAITDAGQMAYFRAFKVAQETVKGMESEIRNMVLTNYRNAGLGQWAGDPDKGLMESEIMQGVVSLRRKGGAKRPGPWYIRFQLRPAAKHYTTRRKDGTTRKRNIHVVATALSYGAVHVRGAIGTRPSFSASTGEQLPDATRLSGAKMRRTIKKAALSLSTRKNLLERMTVKQRIPVMAEFGSATLSIPKNKGYTGKGIRYEVKDNVSGASGTITVIPPRPFLLFTAAQLATIMGRIYGAIKGSTGEGD